MTLSSNMFGGPIVRPPDEARSLSLKVTEGCSHNRCRHCDLYRDQSFHVRPWSDINDDIIALASLGQVSRRLFLADGDALVTDTELLLRVLHKVRTELRWIETVAIYGDTRSAVDKPLEELQALRKAGLTLVYHGLDSGSDRVLREIGKGGTRQEALVFADRLRTANLGHHVIVILGLGGLAYSRLHVEETASALNQIDPSQVSAVPLRLSDELLLRKEFQLPDLATELFGMLSGTHLNNCLWKTHHPSLPGNLRLPTDRERALTVLEHWLSFPEPRSEPQASSDGTRGTEVKEQNFHS
jgi:Radical SAM superfamily